MVDPEGVAIAMNDAKIQRMEGFMVNFALHEKMFHHVVEVIRMDDSLQQAWVIKKLLR